MALSEKSVWKVVLGLVIAMFIVGLMVSYVIFHERSLTPVENIPENTALTFMATTTVTANGNHFLAYKAVTEEERIRGLSGTVPLASTSAMLFVFPADDKWGIWMKDMQYPIDVVWLDNRGSVVDMKENMSTTSCRSELNCKMFFPGVIREDIADLVVLYQKALPSRYVIEFPVGTIEKTKLKTGQRIIIE
jgi:uncharacterized membrane protein (UPF0127 family)